MYRQMTTAVTAAVVLLLVSQASALDWDGSEECEQEAFDYYVKLMVRNTTRHNCWHLFAFKLQKFFSSFLHRIHQLHQNKLILFSLLMFSHLLLHLKT